MCSECKSKVKFEITKQDGILKNYLLKMGMYDYFFESKQSTIYNSSPSTTMPLNYSRQRLTPKSNKFFSHFFKIFLNLFNLIFLSFVFIFTSFKSDIFDLKTWQAFEGILNSKPVLKYEPIVVNMLKNGKESVQLIFLNAINVITNFDFSIEEIVDLANQHSPLVPLSLLILCMIKVFTQENNPITNLIILLNTLLVTVNLNFVFTYFKWFLHRQEDFESDVDGLKYVWLFFPLIGVLLLLEFFLAVEKIFLHRKLFVKPKKFIELNDNRRNPPISTNYNPQNLHYTNNSQVHNNLNSTERPVQYTLNNTKNYSLMKYLGSNSSQAKTVLKETTRKMVMSSSSNNL